MNQPPSTLPHPPGAARLQTRIHLVSQNIPGGNGRRGIKERKEMRHKERERRMRGRRGQIELNLDQVTIF